MPSGISLALWRLVKRLHSYLVALTLLSQKTGIAPRVRVKYISDF